MTAALQRESSDPNGPQRYRLRLDNAGREATVVHLSATGSEEDLILELPDSSVYLEPGKRVTAELLVQPRRRGWSAKPVDLPFDVVIEPEGDARQVVHEFVRRPPTINRVWAAVTAVGVVAVVAILGFVLIRPHPSPAGGGGGGGAGGGGGTDEGWVRADLPGSVAYMGEAGLRVYTPASGKDKSILGIPGVASDPALSLDGKVLAFTVLADSGVSSIYTVQLPNGTPKQVTFPGNGASDIDPALNSDGTQVAFVRGVPHAWHLFTRDLTGLDAALPRDDGNDARPAWSPDSKSIVFHRSTTTEGAGLYILSLDGGTSGWITKDPTDQSPAWSKTDLIVYHANPGGGCCVLVTIDPDTRATHDLGPRGAEPAWSPDGKYVVFHQDSSLVVAYADGSHAEKLLDAGTKNPDPAW